VTVNLPAEKTLSLLAVPVLVMLAKVGASADKLKVPELFATKVKPFQLVPEAPEKVGSAPVKVNVAVLAVIVQFIIVLAIQTIPVPLTFIAEEPIIKIHVPVPEIEKETTSIVCPFKSSVPVKAPMVILVTLTAAVTVTVPPPEEPSKVTVSPEPGTEAPPPPPEEAAQ
jgi:hypothetical protein